MPDYGVTLTGLDSVLDQLGSLSTAILTASAAYVAVGSDVLYAPFVEEGTIHMAAQPFLMPALEAMEPQAVALMDDAVQAVLNGDDPSYVVSAMLQAADLVVEEAQRLVPVRTGNLRDSLHSSVMTR